MKIEYTFEETIKTIRQVLKESFPAVKFSVKRSGRGFSIDISWQDGPTEKAVESRVGVFAGQDFDGMTDSAVSLRAFTKNGERISFFTNYILLNRTYSPKFINNCMTVLRNQYPAEFAKVEADYNAPIAHAVAYKHGWEWSSHVKPLMVGELRLETALHRARVNRMSVKHVPQPSPTFDSFNFSAIQMDIRADRNKTAHAA